MFIEEDLLIAFGGDIIELKKNELLFKDNSVPANYYQIRKGKIKLTNLQAGNREFIQSLHLRGECVGEIFLFSSYHYPLAAVAMEDCTVLRLERGALFKLLKADFEIQLKLFQYIAERMRFNFIFLNSLLYDDAAGRLLTILNFVKDTHHQQEQYCCKIPYTRKDIASLTGLRIETVIRTFKKMEHAGILKIIRGKIFY